MVGSSDPRNTRADEKQSPREDASMTTTKIGGPCVTATRAVTVTGRTWAVAWAAARVADRDVLYLDTETTGLDGRAEIVDIAVVDGAGRVVFESLVRPLAPIPRAASAIHGIEDAHVGAAPTWRDIHQTLAALLADRTVVVYNAPFDRRMVAQSCALHGVEAPRSDWTCAMAAYASFREVATGRTSFRRHRLEQAAGSFGALTGGHRATGDALACRAVVIGMAAAAGFP